MAYGNDSTPTFVVKIPLDLKPNDYRTVEKTVNVANSIYNDMLSEGKKRINKLRTDKAYWKLIKDLKNAKEHNKKCSNQKIDIKPIYFKSRIKNLKFKSRYKDSSFKNKRNDTGLRLVETKNDKYAYKLVLGNKHEINIKKKCFHNIPTKLYVKSRKD